MGDGAQSRSARDHLADACRLYFQNTSDVIYAYDHDFRVRYVSPSVERVLGYTVEEIEGKTFPELNVIAPESIAMAVADAVKVLDGHSVETEEYVFLTRSGERKIGEVSGTKLIEDGEVKLIISVARDITERRRAEAERIASDSNYGVLFRQSPIGVITFDPDLLITDVNDQFLETLKTTREKVIGFDLHDLRDRQVIGYFTAAIRGELGHYEGPYRATTSDADIFIFANSAPLRDADGEIIGGIAAIEDISEQKRIEAALRQSEELHRALFQQSPLGIFVYGTDLVITDCNERLVEMLGSKRDSVIGMDISMLKDQRPVAALMESLEGHKTSYEGPYEATTGTARLDASFIFSPLRDATGSVIGGVATVEDISERKQAEDRLRKSEEIHRALFQQSILGVFTFDDRLRVTDCNDQLLEKVGSPEKDIVIGFDMHNVGDKRILPALEKALMGKAGSYEGPYQTTLGDYEYTLFLLASPLRDAHGDVIGGIAALEDITAQAEAQKELRKYSERLEELVNDRTRQLEAGVGELRSLNEELEAFSYWVSHDLRVPLRAISGVSRMLLDENRDQLDEEGLRLMGLILESTDRMSVLIDDLLGLSRAGRHEMRWAPIDMKAVSSEVIDELSVDLDGRSVRFEVGDLPAAMGDRALVRQVLTNLVDNSIKFTRDNPAALIQVSGHLEGDESIYCIKDNGAGFDMDYSDRLFGVFRRLHSTEEFEGTGVGLALVQRIISRHGGRVWADGAVGQGATFCFALPAITDENPTHR